MNSSQPADPFAILGVLPDADEAEVRARYLELVKQFPPERDPKKFQEIRQAYEAAKDPLMIAKRLIDYPPQSAPQWSDVLNAQKQNPPRLSVPLLLSLGNRADGDSVTP
jgi:curved DNA-binding protein CbpA